MRRFNRLTMLASVALLALPATVFAENDTSPQTLGTIGGDAQQISDSQVSAPPAPVYSDNGNTASAPNSVSSSMGSSAANNGAANSNVPMVSGGIGDGEMDYLRSVQNQYNLKLMFTEGNGMFLSDVPVHIQDKQGSTVVDTVTNGPILLLNLKPGSYRVLADQEGVSREQNVTISTRPGSSSLHAYQFRFPTRDVETSSNSAQ